MAYKIIVLDLDGTLTNSQKEISIATKNAIMKVQKMGIKIVLASGRPTYGIIPVADELEIDKFSGYILSFNGANIINYSSKKLIYEAFLTPDIITHLYDFSKAYNLTIMSYQDNHVITENPEDKYIQLEAKINNIGIEKVENFPKYINFNVPKCMLVGDGDYLCNVEVSLKEKFSDRLSIYRSEPYFLEILPQNVDKAFALSKLLEYIKFSKDELIAFGDGFNDLSMIKYAGLGIAMANAQDVVKNVADYVTLSNDEDGIVKVLNKFVF